MHNGGETTTASFAVSVEDGNEDGSTPPASTFNLTVTPANDPPVLTGDLAATVPEGGSYVLTASDLGFTDADDDEVTFTVSAASNGQVFVGTTAVTSFTSSQLAAGQVSFVHNGGETTTASFAVSVEDGNEDGSTPPASTFNLTVTPANDPPVLTGDLAATVPEGGSYVLTASDLGFTDADDDEVTFTVSAASNGQVFVGTTAVTSFTSSQLAAGQVSFVHNGGETTTASFAVSVEDGNEDGSTPPASTFNLTVTPANDPPVLTGDLAATVPEGGSYVLTASDLGFTDADDDEVTFTVSAASNGQVFVGTTAVTSFTSSQLAAGQVSFVHNGGETTTASFAVSVEDGNEDGSTPPASTFNLTVTPANDPPVLTGDLAATVPEGGSYVLTASDLGFTDADDDEVTFTVSAASNGQVFVGTTAVTSFTSSQLAAGQVSFVHNGGETTTASFAVSVEDGNEDGSTPPASTFNLTVTPANDPPVLTGDLAATVPEGGSYVLTASDLGFTDADDDEVTFTVSAASNGQVFVGTTAVTSFTSSQLAAGQVSFVHNGGETTTASFAVSVEDGNEDGSTPPASTFNLTVTPANDPPVLTGDLAATVPEGGSYVLTASDLGFTDADDDEVTFTVSAASNGQVFVGTTAVTSFTSSQLAAGQVSFVHNGGETTTASFAVSVEDGNEDGSTPPASTFNLTVTPANDPPVLTGDLAATVPEGGSYVLTASDLGFTDADDDEVTFTVSAASNGQVFVGTTAVTSFTSSQLAAGQVSFVHNGSETTTASFAVSVEDGNEDGSTPPASTFNLTVTPANDPPVLTGDLAATVPEGGSYVAHRLRPRLHRCRR